MRQGAVITCEECSSPIDVHGPALCNDEGWPPHWVPYIEDLRTDPAQHRHVGCFAEAQGTDALVEAIMVWQDTNRAELYQLRSRVSSMQGTV